VLVESRLAPERARALFALVAIRPELIQPAPMVSRAVMAQALNMALLDDLLARVPDARAYADDCLREGRRIVHDHGAMRTVALEGMGALPAGDASLVRILAPLGYRLAGLYPLDRLKMTGRSYAQEDYPEDIAQFFISELHVDRFSPAFQAAVARMTGASRDPLTERAKAVLARFEREGQASLEEAVAILGVLVSAFDRQHPPPRLEDYETLIAESAEMAWIATEGNAFNHATDRVADVEAVAAAQRALGRPMKAEVEVAREGRVRQTAFLAARVARPFLKDGAMVERVVPGSFYEFITRLPRTDPETGETGLDLAFDSANAQGIFKMTEARPRP
jgi:hypothetical protein